MRRKTCIAMLLAGGQGSRLGILTKNMAKPAVPFGGKYRIIDFPLSNCSNSGIDVVGVLTQYQPLELNAYLGSGQPWDLDRTNGGVFVLPPYVKGKEGQWYRGTANAIYQNIGFIKQYDPEYVIVLSGDHIYKMDYNAMLQHHIKTGADATIAVFEVPWDEASRFGIMNTDETGKIVEFEEKPAHPKNNLASMGVYVFTWPVLLNYLVKDEADKNSSNDFGKNIIPAMLSDGREMQAYRFSGYWKDVGTIESLWEANMDLLTDPPKFNLYEDRFRIYARNPVMPPHYIGEGAYVHNSMVTEGCEVFGSVEHSLLFYGVTIEKGAVVEDAVIMPGAHVMAGAVVRRAIVGENAEINAGCAVGQESGKIAVVGSNVRLPDNFVVKAGEMADAEFVAKAEGGRELV